MNGVRLDRKKPVVQADGVAPRGAEPAGQEVQAGAPEVRDLYERAKVSLRDDAQAREHLGRIRGSEELADLLRRAKDNFAGEARLEPEHLVLQTLQDQKVALPKDREERLGALAKEKAEGGAGMSERTRLVLLSTSMSAEGTPTVDHLRAVLAGTGEPYAEILQTTLREARRDQLLGLGGAEGAKDKALPRLPLPTLNALTEDLVMQAREGLVDSAVGRTKEVEDVFTALGKRQLSSIVLTGDRGVGKTAIAEGMAVQIARGEVPKGWENARIMKLSASKLASECRQKGAQNVVDALVAESKQALRLEPATPIVLFIDEIHTLTTGEAAGVDLANQLKPALARGGLRVIGATTTEEYRRHIRADAALADRLQAYEIELPKPQVAVQMLLANLDKYARFHGVEIDASAAQAAVDLAKYSEMKLPRGAVDWLDLAGSSVKQQTGAEPPALRRLKNDLRQVKDALEQAKKGNDPDSVRIREKLAEKLEGLTERFETTMAAAEKEKAILDKLQASGDRLAVLEDEEPKDDAAIKAVRADIERERKALNRLPERLYHTRVDAYAVAAAVGNHTGIPLERLQQSGENKYLKVEKELGERVVGQDEAKAALARQIRLDRAKIRNPNKPVGVHFFAGPTGVGKTELAKALADKFYDGNLIRFDCNEMRHEHELARMMGAPPGYVGHDAGSRLAEEIRRCKGHGVLLLDEIEKAHPSIFPLLMQIFDEGRLRDNEGNEIDCTNLQIIMTSNLGSDVFAAQAGDGKYLNRQAVEQGFAAAFEARIPAECRNRLTSTHVFDPLGRASMGKILDIKFGQLATRLGEGRGISLDATQEARAHLAKEGFHPIFGGRSLERTLDAMVGDKLADQLLQGAYEDGDKVKVALKDGAIVFEKAKREARR